MDDEMLFHLPTLFGEACATCPAGDVCRGSASSPCGCKHTGAKRYDCANCYIICRERRDEPGQRYDEEFEVRLAEGRTLAEVRLGQDDYLGPLPPLLPMRVRSLRPEHVAQLDVVAFDLEDLVTDPDQHGLVALRKAFRQDERHLRAHFGIAPGARLLAVLNGTDERLEGMWPKRIEILTQLREVGVTAVTGPTYSISDQDPASHHAIMLMRHHQAMHEAAALGMLAIPNIYWRDEHDIHDAARWLRENLSIHTVSRDFSRTAQQAAFQRQFEGLLTLLRQVGRSLHVVVVGVGYGRGAYVLNRLATVGCTGSIATPNPVIMGHRGQRIVRKSAVRLTSTPDRVPLRKDLAWENVRLLEADLAATAGAVCPNPALA